MRSGSCGWSPSRSSRIARMPSARAPSISSAYESPTITVSAAATPSDAQGSLEDRGMRLRPAVGLRANRDVDVERVMARERLEVPLPVRDQPDPELGGPERPEHGDRIVVEVEVGVNLPAPDDLDRACPRALGVAAHAADDVLGERDPDLLVVHELGVHPQVGEGRDPRRLVASGSRLRPCVLAPTRRYASGPSSGPGRDSVKSTSNRTARSIVLRA